MSAIKDWLTDIFSHMKWVKIFFVCPNCHEHVSWHINDSELLSHGDVIRMCPNCSKSIYLGLEAR